MPDVELPPAADDEGVVALEEDDEAGRSDCAQAPMLQAAAMTEISLRVVFIERLFQELRVARRSRADVRTPASGGAGAGPRRARRALRHFEAEAPDAAALAFLAGMAGVPGVAGVAGDAGEAPMPAVGSAGVARVAGIAGVAGVAGVAAFGDGDGDVAGVVCAIAPAALTASRAASSLAVLVMDELLPELNEAPCCRLAAAGP